MCEGLPRALAFSRRNAMELPAEFADDDVRFSDEFADYFIRRFSSPGEVVFDPFAG